MAFCVCRVEDHCRAQVFASVAPIPLQHRQVSCGNMSVGGTHIERQCLNGVPTAPWPSSGRRAAQGPRASAIARVSPSLPVIEGSGDQSSAPPLAPDGRPFPNPFPSAAWLLSAARLREARGYSAWWDFRRRRAVAVIRRSPRRKQRPSRRRCAGAYVSEVLPTAPSAGPFAPFDSCMRPRLSRSREGVCASTGRCGDRARVGQ